MLIVAGPFLIWAGLHTYGRLSDLEDGTVESIRVSRFDKLLYTIGGKTTVLVVFCALGAFYLFALYRFLKFDREARARIDAAEQRIAAAHEPLAVELPAKPFEAPLPPPPRLGDDPFRDPPGPKPIIVQKAEIAAAPAPRASTPAVTSDSTDGPKFLK
jgi:hypothetical protein